MNFFKKFNYIEECVFEHILDKLESFKVKYMKYALKLLELQPQIVDVVDSKLEEIKEDGGNLKWNYPVRIDRLTDREYWESCIENILFETNQEITIIKSVSSGADIDDLIWEYAIHNEGNVYELLLLVDFATGSGYELGIDDAGNVYRIMLELYNELIKINSFIKYYEYRMYKQHQEQIEN